MVFGSADRVPPPDVPPLERAGIRYEQVDDITGIDTEDPCGWMRATRIADGAEVWVSKVYTVAPVTAFEGAYAEVFFKHMEMDPSGGAIIVTNEDDDRFSVELTTGRATPLP